MNHPTQKAMPDSPDTCVDSVVRCPDCHHSPCACPLIEQARFSRKRETDAILEAQMYRELWEAAASCLQHNRKRIAPRGEDERRMLEAAERCMCGHYWSGKTDGWRPEPE